MLTSERYALCNLYGADTWVKPKFGTRDSTGVKILIDVDPNPNTTLRSTYFNYEFENIDSNGSITVTLEGKVASTAVWYKGFPDSEITEMSYTFNDMSYAKPNATCGGPIVCVVDGNRKVTASDYSYEYESGGRLFFDFFTTSAGYPAKQYIAIRLSLENTDYMKYIMENLLVGDNITKGYIKYLDYKLPYSVNIKKQNSNDTGFSINLTYSNSNNYDITINLEIYSSYSTYTPIYSNSDFNVSENINCFYRKTSDEYYLTIKVTATLNKYYANKRNVNIHVEYPLYNNTSKDFNTGSVSGTSINIEHEAHYPSKYPSHTDIVIVIS